MRSAAPSAHSSVGQDVRASQQAVAATTLSREDSNALKFVQLDDASPTHAKQSEGGGPASVFMHAMRRSAPAVHGPAHEATSWSAMETLLGISMIVSFVVMIGVIWRVRIFIAPNGQRTSEVSAEEKDGTLHSSLACHISVPSILTSLP